MLSEMAIFEYSLVTLDNISNAANKTCCWPSMHLIYIFLAGLKCLISIALYFTSHVINRHASELI